MSEHTFLPINYPDLLKFRTDLEAIFWFASEINLHRDREDYEKLSPSIQKFIKTVLAFFAPADGLISENLVTRFISEVSNLYKEAGFFYTVQNHNELIHNETYSLLIDVLFSNIDEKNALLDAVHNYPAVKNISEWMTSVMRSDAPLQERLYSFACIEGGLFNAAFAAIYYIKRKNVLPGLCQANEFIARDEAIHARFASALYNRMIQDLDPVNCYNNLDRLKTIFKPLDRSTVIRITEEAVELSNRLVIDALDVELIDITREDMMQYIKCTFDVLVESFGFEKIYNTSNPFDWMIMTSLANKTNFFEKNVTDYARTTKKNITYIMDTDF